MDPLRFDGLARRVTEFVPPARLARFAGAALVGAALTGSRAGQRTARAAVCPNRIPKPGYTPSTNGCGPEGGTKFPGRIWGADFATACDGHDVCYGTCNRDRTHCDKEFNDDMHAACAAEGIATYLLTNCTRIADTYFSAVALFGGDAYDAAQSDACTCCGGDACRKKDGTDICCRADQPLCCNGGCWLEGSINCGPYCCPPKTTCCGPEQRCCAEGFECRDDCASGGYACQRIGSGAC